MSYPKDLPREMKNLWRLQYEPREKKLKRIIEPDKLKMYNKLSWSNKINVIDDLQEKGIFD